MRYLFVALFALLLLLTSCDPKYVDRSKEPTKPTVPADTVKDDDKDDDDNGDKDKEHGKSKDKGKGNR